MALKQKLIEHICDYLHRRCSHPDSGVVADLLDGDAGLGWCRACGAILKGNYWALAVSPWRKGAVTQEVPGALVDQLKQRVHENPVRALRRLNAFLEDSQDPGS